MNNLIAPFKQTKWIVLSALSFIFPSLFAFHTNIYCLSTASTCIFLCSLNYWRDARYSIRRNIDIIVAYSGFTTYVIYGFLYINNSFIIYTSISMCGFIYSIYKISENRYYINKNNLSWVRYHMLFHLFSAFQQSVIINYSTNYSTNYSRICITNNNNLLIY